MKTKIVTYESDFYHNGHGQQRDQLLIELYGEEWLKEQKSKGFYGGDWREEIIGTTKSEPSGYINQDGNLTISTEIIKINSPGDLDQIHQNK